MLLYSNPWTHQTHTFGSTPTSLRYSAWGWRYNDGW